MRVAVVGSGVAGASAAFHLASYGADVVLIDDARPGLATAAGAGIVCPWASGVPDPDFYRIGAAAALFYPSLIEQLEAGGLRTSYREVGALLLPGENHDLDSLIARVKPRAGDGGFTVEQLSTADARELFPPIRAADGAVHLSSGARVDGRKLRAALLSAASNLGVQPIAGSGIVHSDGDRIRGVDVEGELNEADAVVVAAGCWSAAALEPAGVVLPVEPQRGQIVHLGVDGDTAEWPVVLPDADHYLLSFDDARVVVGATRETGSGDDPRITAGGLAHVLRNALEVAPGLADAEIVETRVGLRPMSPDGLPIAGAIGPDGLYVLSGLGPVGLTMGPFLGAQIAHLVTGDEPELDLAAYSPTRFR